MNKPQDGQNNSVSQNINPGIVKLMELILLKKWEEVQTEWDREQDKPHPDKGVTAIAPLINSRCDLLDDFKYNEAQRFLSSEWKAKIELIRNNVLSVHYLKECMKEYNVSEETHLCHATQPLLENANYQNSRRYASPERIRYLEKLQFEQAECFLTRCIQNNNVSDEEELQKVSAPVAEDEMFQSALKYASPERQKHLHGIVQGQVECFVKKCMKDNLVEKEAELKYVSSPLPLNDDYLKALNYASSERKKELLEIQYSQIENILKQYLYENKKLLIHKNNLLASDKDFKRFHQFASPKLQEELNEICNEQRKEFENKAYIMEINKKEHDSLKFQLVKTEKECESNRLQISEFEKERDDLKYQLSEMEKKCNELKHQLKETEDARDNFLRMHEQEKNRILDLERQIPKKKAKHRKDTNILITFFAGLLAVLISPLFLFVAGIALIIAIVVALAVGGLPKVFFDHFSPDLDFEEEKPIHEKYQDYDYEAAFDHQLYPNHALFPLPVQQGDDFVAYGLKKDDYINLLLSKSNVDEFENFTL